MKEGERDTETEREKERERENKRERGGEGGRGRKGDLILTYVLIEMDGSLNGPFDQGHTGTCSFSIQLEHPHRRDCQPNAMIVIAESVKRRWFLVWFLNVIHSLDAIGDQLWPIDNGKVRENHEWGGG